MGIIGMFTTLLMKTAAVSLMMTPVIAVTLAVRAGLARIGVSAGVRYRLWVIPAAALVIAALCASGALAGYMPLYTLQGNYGAASSGSISAVSADNAQAADTVSSNASGVGIDGITSRDPAAGRTGKITVDMNEQESAIYNIKENLASSIFDDPADKIKHLSSTMIAVSGIWLAGVICIFAFAAVSCARVRRQTRFAVRVGGSDDASKYIKAFSAVKGRRIYIYESREIELPFVSGAVRPRIYMPAGMADDDAANVIAHEAEHIRRRDSAVILIAWACCAVSWFNPFLWTAYAMLRRDMEMSCDEAVTESMSREDTSRYMKTMLRMSAPGAHRGQNAFMPGFATGESDVELRVENLVSEKKHRPLATAAAVVLCIAMVVGCVFGYSRYQAKYYNINDVELLTAEQVVKLLKINGVRLTADSGYDAENMAVKLNSLDDDTRTVPYVYNVRVMNMNVKIFMYIFNRYVDHDSEFIDIPYPGSENAGSEDGSDESDPAIWKASLDDRAIYGKNILMIPYLTEGEVYKGMNVDRQRYEAGADISDSDMNTIARRSRAYNDMRDNINDILFYKAFEGTDTIYAGESGDWRFAFPVKMFSLSYTDDNGDEWISAMKSAGYLYMSYKDGDPTLYGPVKSISVTKGDRSSQHSFGDDYHLEYVYDESSDDMGGMYRVMNFDFAGRFKWHCDSIGVTLGLMDGSKVTAECTDIE